MDTWLWFLVRRFVFIIINICTDGQLPLYIVYCCWRIIVSIPTRVHLGMPHVAIHVVAPNTCSQTVSRS